MPPPILRQGGVLIEVAAVAVIGSCIILWRVGALSQHGDPVGVDVGNLLHVSEAWIGRIDVGGVIYPPLVPAAAAGLRWLFGASVASHWLQAVAGVAPGLGLWVAFRKVPLWIFPAAASVMLAVAWPTSAAAAWGGVPQLLGLGLWPVIVHAGVAWLDRPTRGQALKLGVLLCLLAMTSTLIFAAALGSMAVVALVGARRGVARSWSTLLWALLPLSFAAPWYALSIARLSVPASSAARMGAADIVREVLGRPLWIWPPLAVLAIVGVLTASRRPGSTRIMIGALIVPALVALLLGEVRGGYLLPTAIAAGICGCGLAELRRKRVLEMIALVAVLPTLYTAGGALQTHVDFYERFVPRGTVAAAQWLRAHVSSDDVVVVAPVDGAPTGWWIEALGVDALVASRDDWLYFPSERSDARLANEVLSAPRWPQSFNVDLMNQHHVSWIYLPTGWGGIDPAALDEAVAAGRLSIAFNGPGATIIRVDRPALSN